MMEKKLCRHERNSWFFLQVNSAVEWCYCCGAIRQLDRVSANSPFTAGKWQKPVGQDGKNPALKG